jgi:hypothetical protein
MIGGIGEAAHEKNALLMSQEVERRKGLVEMYQFLYDKPDMPPEMKQKFLEFMIEIPQHPYDKKLPKHYTDLGGLMQFRQQIPPPVLPPSGSIPAAPGDVVPFAPEGSPASFEYDPSEQATLMARRSEAETATEANRIQMLQRRTGMTPTGYTAPRPVIGSPGQTIMPTGPGGAIDMSQAFTLPDPSGGDGAKAGSIENLTQQNRALMEQELGRPLNPQEIYQADLDAREKFINADPNLRMINQMRMDRLETEGRAELTPVQFQWATQLANQFFSQSTGYLERQRNFDAIIASAREPSAAGDLSLIFAYMKILDPTSVVRESEQASAANAAGVPPRIRNLWNRWKTGQKLAPEQRADFVNRARKLMSAAQIQQGRLAQRFSTLASSQGVDRKYVVMDFMPVEPIRERTSFSDDEFVE